MLNFGQLTNTVQRNCNISDARHAGSYSMCIFLLKMREYYRWENDIPLTGALPHDKVGDWMIKREHDWEQLESVNYESLPVQNQRIDPFDAESVNRELIPHGFVYSSGVGLFGKPHFFLGELRHHEVREGISIHVSACEYARDLVAPPAMTRGGTVFVSRESVRRLVWEKIEEWQWNKKSEGPMKNVIQACGPDHNPDELLDSLTEDVTELMILHEVGECRAGRMLGQYWDEMLAELPHSTASILARAVRDLLADCLVTLPTLLENGNQLALHFHFANLAGMRKKLFPEAMRAYQQWSEHGDHTALLETAQHGVDHWRRRAEDILTVYAQHGSESQSAIEALFPD